MAPSLTGQLYIFVSSTCGVSTVGLYYVGISIGSRTGQGSYQMRGYYDNIMDSVYIVASVSEQENSAGEGV